MRVFGAGFSLGVDVKGLGCRAQGQLAVRVIYHPFSHAQEHFLRSLEPKGLIKGLGVRVCGFRVMGLNGVSYLFRLLGLRFS